MDPSKIYFLLKISLDAKLVPAMPVCTPEKWHSRTQQILGFRQFADQLSSWLSTLNPEYHAEVECSLLGKSMPGKSGEAERSQRLYFILRQVFWGSSKTMAIVRLFDAQVGSHDGFLLLSKLATEFSLCTRTEAIFFKQCMANFKLGKQGSVRDAVQLLESEMYLYEKLVQTISDSTLRSEMFLQDGEKSRLLMLNLPENVRTFLQLHGGDTYTSQRDAAIRYYERTELISQDFSNVPSLTFMVGCIGTCHVWITFVLIQCWKSFESLFEKKEDPTENMPSEVIAAAMPTSASSHENHAPIPRKQPCIYTTATGECYHVKECEILRKRNVTTSKHYRACKVRIRDSYEIHRHG